MLVSAAPSTAMVQERSKLLEIHPRTLTSHFYGSRLPSPKQYLAMVRLVYARSLLESPGARLTDVACRLEYSSPRSFGRHVLSVLGVTAGEFRRSYRIEDVERCLIEKLIVPFRTRWRRFGD